jgi:hypothetical protein
MRGLLVVTMLVMAVLIVLPPAQSPEVNTFSTPHAADLGVLTAIAMLFTGLRDLLYGVGEAAITVSAGLWEILPERLKPVVGVLVLGVSSLALLGLLTLSGAIGVWRRIMN